MIEEDLLSHLSTEVTLVSGRVYPLKLKQDALFPAMVLTVVNDKDRNSVNNGRFGFDIRVQIDCYAKTYAEVKQLKGAVQTAMYIFSLYPHGFNSQDGFEEYTLCCLVFIIVKTTHT